MGKRYSGNDAIDSLNTNQDVENENNKGTNKNLKIILLILIIPIVAVGSYFGYNFYKKNDTLTPTVASNNKKEEKMENEYIGGYEVIGNIQIEKINLNTKILNPEIEEVKYVDDALKFGLVKFYGEEINEIGNFCIIGHNTSEFINLKELVVGDEIKLADNNGKQMNYIVTEVMRVSPDDMTVLIPNESEAEITLITCEDGATTRLVIKAINN